MKIVEVTLEEKMKRKQKRNFLIIGIIVLVFVYQIYQLYNDHRIENLLNSFSRSTQCDIILASGNEIFIDGAEWKNINKEGVGFFIIDNGSEIYKAQEIIDLMTVKLYKDNKLLSTLQIKEIISSKKMIKELNDHASSMLDSNHSKYYDIINDRKIIVIGNKFNCINMEEFLQTLFDYLNAKEYLY